MKATANTVGTIEWTRRTGGNLETAERRRLVADLARVHVGNVLGRGSAMLRLNSGRRANVSSDRRVPPDSPLTRAADDAATRILTPSLLNHSHRAYRFGRALGDLEGLEVDDELLFAAALLHDTGLVLTDGSADFTLASARVARDVAAGVGISNRASETMQTAITMHYNPRVSPDVGPEAYLLAAGAGVDVAGLRSWQLPRTVLDDAVRLHPREGFKVYFTKAWAAEVARVPRGRAQLLKRYGAFSTAIALAPFEE